MQIDVVGGGSIGLLFGARLAEAGADVVIWTRSKEQADLVSERGVLVRELGGSSEQSIAIQGAWVQDHNFIRTLTARKGGKRWILLAVKQTSVNDQLLAFLDRFISDSGESDVALVCLQNGLGHLERIKAKLPSIPLFAAVVTEGARRIDGHSVEHTGKGELWMGEWKANGRKRDIIEDNSLEMFVSMLQSAGFASFLSNELENRIYNKLLINAVINPLTAIFDVQNGQLPMHASRLQLMRALYIETEHVLVQAGMQAPRDGWQTVMDVCRNTSRNVSSMLSDIREGRATEIDTINGGVLMLARQYGQQAPLNEAVIELVKALHPKPDTEE
ncbi:ketopantoate reductase family protein [Paenibacillus sp. 2TAB23]|uniref:ketopantoate reductase family protein n=1 Tax=Paenibacillus sp. 2TAB23 TaxID=3233004 RepID=UPI003F9D8E03